MLATSPLPLLWLAEKHPKMLAGRQDFLHFMSTTQACLPVFFEGNLACLYDHLLDAFPPPVREGFNHL